MTSALFIGGPWDGRLVAVPDPPPLKMHVPVLAEHRLTLATMTGPVPEVTEIREAMYHRCRYAWEDGSRWAYVVEGFRAERPLLAVAP